MKVHRFALTLISAIVLLCSAWLPTGYAAAPGSGEPSGAPAGLSAAGWESIQSQVAKLTAADGAALDYLGWSVSVSGDTAVVGAYRAGVGGNEFQGAAYVFYRNQGGADAWGQVAKLTSDDGASNDSFGISVSVSGGTAVVGATGADGATVGAGAAYLFDRDQGGPDAWGQVAKLAAADGAPGDLFGSSVSISGNTALVAARFAAVGGIYFAGAAYIFERDPGGAWGQVAKLTASDGAIWDGFGWSVSISGDTAVVGSYQAQIDGVSLGAGYVYDRNQGGADTWGRVTKLTAPGGQPMGRFGISVSVDGDTILVGDTWAQVGDNIEQGAAYIFYRDQDGPGAWGRVATLTASDGTTYDLFGCSVSVSGDTAVVGAYYAEVGDNLSQGAAYAYHRYQGGADAWGQVAKLTASDGAEADYFGNSVSVSGATSLVGAFMATVGGNVGQGAAYIHSLPSAPMYVAKTKLRWRVARTPTGQPPGRPSGVLVLSEVRIDDASHAGVAGATVYGEWTLPEGSVLAQTGQLPTDPQGRADFEVLDTQSGIYQFCVTGVDLEGFFYAPYLNEAPACQTIDAGR